MSYKNDYIDCVRSYYLGVDDNLKDNQSISDKAVININTIPLNKRERHYINSAILEELF